MTRRLSIGFALALVIVLALGVGFGCSGDDDDDSAPIETGDDEDGDTGGPGDDNDTVGVDELDDRWDSCEPDDLAQQTYDESGESGPLRLKAMAHDAQVEQWHLPDYGSHVHVKFTDETRTVVSSYHGHGDSCIWTGTYITGQALRYLVTGDEQARANVIRSAASLSRHEHVTGRPGFIARYVGKADTPGQASYVARCPSDENCHLIEDGEFAGDFWVGNTSRDQYTGWFMGMAFAYDLIDDEAMRAQIEVDVAEVLDRLIADQWWIIDFDGEPTTKAPNVLGSQKMNWSLIGYHITGEERFFEVFKRWAAYDKRDQLRLGNLGRMNQYAQHYGLNLAHENFLNLMRLSKPYCEVHDFLVDLFTEQTHAIVDLAHNPWYTGVYLAQADVDDETWAVHRAQIIQDLTDFHDAPKVEYAMQPPEAPLDPVSVLLYELQQALPWLSDLIGTIHPQAKDAYPVRYQCSSGFIFQRNMWAIECGGTDDPTMVNSGHDYLVAYWLASAYGILDKTD